LEEIEVWGLRLDFEMFNWLNQGRLTMKKIKVWMSFNDLIVDSQNLIADSQMVLINGFKTSISRSKGQK
jgi:hypothetical protein